MKKIENEFNFKSETFKKLKKPFSERFNDFADKIMSHIIFNNFINRPIGIIRKDSQIINMTLSRKIGTAQITYDGYGSPIGSIGYVNYIDRPEKYKWNSHGNRINYDNYINYLKNIDVNYDEVFNDGSLYNSVPIPELMVVKHLSDQPSYRNNDTRLAQLGAFYLDRTLYNNVRNDLDKKILKRDRGSFADMLNNSVKESKYNTITKNLYQEFSKNNNINTSKELSIGKIKPIYEYFGLENDKNDDIKGLTDASKIVDKSYINKLGNKTRNFIYKSLLGKDLINDDNDIEELNEDSLKMYITNNSYVNHFGSNVRYDLFDIGNENYSNKQLHVYSEPDNNNIGEGPINFGSYNDGIATGSYTAYKNSYIKDDIISYTNNLFNSNKIDTLIGRFHTKPISDDLTTSAISKEYGMSHGRNLLKADHTGKTTNGYSNPYCRVWTYHHQYSKLQDTIRPFQDDKLKTSEMSYYRLTDSFDKLKDFGVKGPNKLVKFAPYSETEKKDKEGNVIKSNSRNVMNCMFSIENLAWKDEKKMFENYEEQRGPLGGRIMWFPPYDLKFSENVRVNWNSNQFIGRGENIYTYTNTERSGQLSFKLLIDHPSIINRYNNAIEESSEVDDVDSVEQQLLRFFAGCGIPDNLQSDKDEEPPTPPAPPKPVINEVVSTYNEINFFVFFPNNYSGVDDGPSSEVPAMEYLINGVGTNHYFTKTGDTISLFNERIANYQVMPSDENGIGYEMSGIGISEIGEGLGKYKGNDEDGKNASYENYVKSAEMGNDSNDYFSVQTGKNKKVWGYRVDKRVDNEILRNKNYTDNKSFNLNSDGYKKLVQVHTDAQKFLDNGTLYSFSDVFAALEPLYSNKASDENKSMEVKKLLDEYEVKRIEIVGYASSHGKVASNKKLASDRANSVNNWLKKTNSTKFNKEFKYIHSDIGSNLSTTSINDFEPKAWRCVRVTIKLEKETVVEKNQTQDANLNNGDPYGTSSNKTKDNDNDFFLNEKVTSYYPSDNTFNGDNYSKKAFYDSSLYNKKDNNLFKYNPDFTPFQKDMARINLNLSINQMKLDANAKNHARINRRNKNDIGYRNEYEFFKILEKEKPFLHQKLVDKIKYFDPAFHSITPEGFQSRLTFLQQCTRQGNTNGASDGTNLRNASNLAFGKIGRAHV